MNQREEESGGTPLHTTCRRSEPDRDEIVKLLVAAGAGMSLKDGKGRTPLSLAVNHCRIDTVKLLLAAGADPSVTANDPAGWSAGSTAGPGDACPKEQVYRLLEAALKARKRPASARVRPRARGPRTTSPRS
jgi:hypothetical protein